MKKFIIEFIEIIIFQALPMFFSIFSIISSLLFVLAGEYLYSLTFLMIFLISKNIALYFKPHYSSFKKPVLELNDFWKIKVKKIRKFLYSKDITTKLNIFQSIALDWHVSRNNPNVINISTASINSFNIKMLKSLVLHEYFHIKNKDLHWINYVIRLTLKFLSVSLFNLYSRFIEMRADNYSINNWKHSWFKSYRISFEKIANNDKNYIYNCKNKTVIKNLYNLIVLNEGWKTHPSFTTRKNLIWKIELKHYLTFFK